VILINLLPHREEKRKRRKQAFFAALGLSAVAGLAISGGWWAGVQQMIASQQERNTYLEGENRKLDVQIRDIASLRTEIDALKARQKAVEDLQADRNVPVHLLNELAKQVPEGVFLNTLKQAGGVVTVTGMAQTNERVSEFLRNTAYSSTWLEKPELVEIKSVLPTAKDAQQRRLYEFAMRLTIKRPQSDKPDAKAGPASVAVANPKATAKAP
jgi:type IV pilus assembly protein PilN